jgi:hypothetical protein
MISIIIPTITPRIEAGWFRRCSTAYAEFTTVPYEILVEIDHPTCGLAWNAGRKRAKGDYIHYTADDIEPTANWDVVGMEWADKGVLPAARILNTDGTLQSCGDAAIETDTGTVTELARIPFATAEQMEAIGEIIEVHYATDHYFSHRGRDLGWPSLVVREFCFYHHFAPQGRLDSRLMADMKAYWDKTGQKR